MKTTNSFLTKIDNSINLEDSNNLFSDYSFYYVNIEKNENPTEFFNWALKHKLYKSSKDISFTSHMKVIYENSLETFNGVSAVVSVYKKTNKPVSIAFLKHFLNKDSTRKSNLEFINLFNQSTKPHPKKPQMVVESDFPALVHKAGIHHQDNRERINPWQKQFNFHIMHLGFAMLYTKPTHRLKSLSKMCWKLLEQSELNRITKHCHFLPKEVINNELLVCVTAKAQAFNIIKKDSQNFIPSHRDNTAISSIVSELSYAKYFQERFDEKIVKLKENPENQIKIKPL